MGRHVKNKMLGFYQPAFYFLELNSHQDVFDSGMNVIDKPTFFHEYIHYLQDITSTFGVMNLSHSLSMIINGANQIRLMSQSEISVPISSTKFGNTTTNDELLSIYQGDYEDFTISSGVVIKSAALEENGVVPGFERANLLEVVLSDGKKMTVGAIHILESMANILEHYVFAEPLHQDYYPYCSVLNLAKYKCPSIANDLKILSAICDVSLMYFNPAEVLWLLLCEIADNGSKKITYEDIYSLADKLPVSESKEQQHDSVILKASEYIDHIFSNGVHRDVRDYMKNCLMNGKRARINHQTFLRDIFDTAWKPPYQELLNKLIIKYDMPMAFNNVGKGWRADLTKTGGNNIILLRALFDFYLKIYEGKSMTCSLIPYCNSIPSGSITDKSCVAEPWKRSIGDNICPFGQIWKVAGLSSKTLKN